MFLNGCLNAMDSVEYLEELDHPSNMKKILSKPPYKLKEKWRVKACELQDRDGRRARFADLVQFVNNQAQIPSHVIFRNLKDTAPTMRGNSIPQPPHSSMEQRSKIGFVTCVAPVTKPSTVTGGDHHGPSSTSKMHAKSCLFCIGAHNLDFCPQINKKSHKDKLEFLKKKGVCFGCLEVGHISKRYTQRLTCQKCSLKHPTTLHITNQEANTS